jgi:hypothetical protein
MQLAYIFLARYAEPNPDGTVASHGGDFDIVRAEAFPALFPLSIVAKLIDPPAGEGAELPILLDIITPAGTSLLEEPFCVALKPRKVARNLNATKPDTARLVFNLGPVQFPEPGRYEIRLQFGTGADEIHAAVPLTAEVTSA